MEGTDLMMNITHLRRALLAVRSDAQKDYSDEESWKAFAEREQRQADSGNHSGDAAQRNRLLSSHPGNEGITSSTTIAVSPNSVDSRQQQTSAYCYCGSCFWNSLSAEMQQKYIHPLLTAQ